MWHDCQEQLENCQKKLEECERKRKELIENIMGTYLTALGMDETARGTFLADLRKPAPDIDELGKRITEKLKQLYKKHE